MRPSATSARCANDDFDCAFASAPPTGRRWWRCRARWAASAASPPVWPTISSRAPPTSRSRSGASWSSSLRETPLSLLHLENMVTVARAGAIVLPAAPSFYTRPGTVDAVVDTVVARVLDQLGIAASLSPRWGQSP